MEIDNVISMIISTTMADERPMDDISAGGDELDEKCD
jgi:hypothetical protein